MPKKLTKIFVLDTSVILHDFNAISSFKEHDIAIPITVLEEVDHFKKGSTQINLHAREFVRKMDKLSSNDMLQNWIPLNGKASGKFKVVVDTDIDMDTNKLFGSEKNDHRILNTAIKLSQEFPKRKVILVTKDINLRVKARALNIIAEDFETDKIKDIDHLDKGISILEITNAAAIDAVYADGAVPYKKVTKTKPKSNQYFVLKSGSKSALTWFNAQSECLERVQKVSAYGVTPRNAEQTFALHALLNDDIKLVAVSGAAGTGKTLLALAAAIERRQHYRQIYLARPIVPLSNKDIGFLPGDIKSKINPYMQPLWDNLDLIKSQFSEKEKEFKKIAEMVELDKLHITPLAYIRGRSLSNIFFVIDEAQNLTPHEIKTIITRAGEHTKIVFTGDIFQIDTPYLDAQSNGLSYLIDKVKDHPLYAHVNLEKGERSDLANLASSML